MRRLALSGKRFSRWTVLAYHHTTSGRAYWLCCCDCGTERTVYGMSLTRGVTQSCGCWRREVSVGLGKMRKGSTGNRGATRTHGEAIARTAEYRTWLSMHERCRNKDRADYGGRGITVCERWSSYDNFLTDMGRRPSPSLSLDRIDNDQGYGPDNCRWATKLQQQQNRRKFARIDRFTTSELLTEIARRNTDPAIYLSHPG